jgi:hypothetical protein
MFIGHWAVGLASKRVAPRASLGVLMAAPNLLDLLWPIFLLLGSEQVRIDPGNTPFTPLDFVSYPISHSLLTACGWGALFGLVYWAVTRSDRGAVVIGLSVVSHWVLDYVTHRPDLPLWPGGPRVGLGLWNSVPATVAVEVAMYAGGRVAVPFDDAGAGSGGRLGAVGVPGVRRSDVRGEHSGSAAAGCAHARVGRVGAVGVAGVGVVD